MMIGMDLGGNGDDGIPVPNYSSKANTDVKEAENGKDGIAIFEFYY